MVSHYGLPFYPISIDLSISFSAVSRTVSPSVFCFYDERHWQRRPISQSPSPPKNNTAQESAGIVWFLWIFVRFHVWHIPLGTKCQRRKAQVLSEPVLFCILFLFLPADNAIVSMGSKPINHHIEHAEYQKCADVGAYRQPLIGQAEHGQQLPYQGGTQRPDGCPPSKAG